MEGWPVLDQAGIILTIGIALWVGVMTLSLARRFKVPPILFFILAGVALGPMGLDWIRPASLGEGLSILVEFGLAVMLFEGALSLPGSGLKPLPVPSRRLLGLAMPLTALLAGLAAWFFAGFGLLPAATFGALIVVTGPTTIGPLLRALPISRRLEVLFRHEAIWGDCLGILLASALLPFWLAGDSAHFYFVPYHILEKAALSTILGLAVGLLLGKVLLPALTHLGDPELPGMVALSCAVLAFAAGQAISPGSGPIASAVAGFTLAAQKSPYVREVRFFKGQIAYLFISMFFVLLAALFEPSAVPGSFLPLVVTSLVIGIFVRPVSMLAGLWKTGLPLNERIYVGLIGPRGIIALATASFLVTQAPGNSMALRVFALTFLVILFSGAFATLFGRPLTRLMRMRVSEHDSGILIIGIHEFSKRLASALSRKVPVKLADSDPLKVLDTKLDDVEVLLANGLDDDLYESAQEDGFRRVLAMTPNDALNTMILEHAEALYGPNRVFQVLYHPDHDLFLRKPHLKRHIAFAEDFTLYGLENPKIPWALKETKSVGKGQIALASGAKGGARIIRAGGADDGPYLVLDYGTGPDSTG
jgi:NhaP-type Na+/H+ or K+/H+ antiporter